jgi:hypothetical protein
MKNLALALSVPALKDKFANLLLDDTGIICGRFFKVSRLMASLLLLLLLPGSSIAQQPSGRAATVTDPPTGAASGRRLALLKQLRKMR